MKTHKRLAPLFETFKSRMGATVKSPASPRSESLEAHVSLPASIGDVSATPTWWGIGFAWVLAATFCWLIHQFFLWCPPYLQEIVKNLRGLPYAWFEPKLFWTERGLMAIAAFSALYHTLWKLFTRYWLTANDIQIKTWFPMRRIQAIPYGAVQRIGIQQSFLGVLLRYGQVEIDTGSPLGPVFLQNCPKPEEFLKILRQRVETVLHSYPPQTKN